MRSGKRGQRTARVVLILTIAAGVALAIAGGGEALADTVWGHGQTSAAVAVPAGK